MHEHHHAVHTDSADELRALMEYMVKHNASHAAELRQIAARLSDGGKTLASEKTLAALEAYTQGNTLLQEALDLFKGETE